MRVINLDETGIKLMSNNKHQIYITREEIIDLVKGKYKILDNILTFNEHQLPLSQEEVKDFQITLDYLKTEILKENR